MTARVSVPVVNDPAVTLIEALPLLKIVAAEVKLPLVSVTVPAGVGLPVPPFTVTVTVSVCAVVMLVEEGVTVTVGVIFDTVTVFEPDALL
jgi:hypothetical protein